jgi:hypothetical protein
MTRQLVMVHGRAQEFKDPTALKAEWLDALRKGLAKSGLDLPIAEKDVRFPYYGQTLSDLVVGEGAIAEVIVKGASASVEERVFLASVVEEVRRDKGISDARVEQLAGGEVAEKGPLNWAWVQAGLRAIDEYVPGGGAVLAAFTFDVYQYLENRGVSDTIEMGVRQAFRQAGSSVIVGHSLGAVVSYALLRREGQAQGWDVPLYVTVGAPLGVAAIRRRLSPLNHPRCVEKWFNARDSRDVVALNPLDAAHFAVDPAVENKNDVANHTSNRHGIAGYLDDAVVARRIHDALVA